MRQNDVLFWIWFAEALGAANSDFRKILELYESPYEVFVAEAEELERRAGLRGKTVANLSNKSLKRASEILDNCERLGIGLMPYDSELYPQSLKEIKNPPVLLYYAGRVPRLSDYLCVGVVGNRKMSAYGMETAYKISYELARKNVITVSGLAEGIDGVCGAATMRANGFTVAVLGCGLDRAYPLHHGKLMNEVAKNGLLLSEYPPGTKPIRYHFPIRNRIISGLSHAIAVIEAGLESGSLITARDAVMQGKDVFAVPSNANGIGSEGTNGLLRDGAYFATCAEDILRKYEYLFPMSAGAIEKCPNVDLDYLRSMGVISGRVKLGDGNCKSNVTRSSDEPGRKGSERENREYRANVKNENHEGADATLKDSSLSSEKKRPMGASQSLTPLQEEVLQAIPDDRTVSSDALMRLEHPYGEILTALTMLEVMGLVEKLPGAVYRKV